MSRIAQDLGPFLLVTTEDTLSLVLETMSVVLDVDKGQWLTTDLANSLVLAVLEVWAKNNKGCPYIYLPFNELNKCNRSNFLVNFHGHIRVAGLFDWRGNIRKCC